MPDVCVIEVGDRAAGLVAREEKGLFYRFHAALPEAFPLDGCRFPTPDAAREAVRELLRGGPGRPKGHLPRAA